MSKMSKRGQFIFSGMMVLGVLIVALVVLFVLYLAFDNLYQLIGGAIAIISLFVVVPVAINKDSTGGYWVVAILLTISAVLLLGPLLADNMYYSVASIGSWEQSDIPCDEVGDCYDSLIEKGISESVVEVNQNKTKCEEVCYFLE